MLEYPLLCRLCGLKTENGLYIYCDEGKRRQVETKIRLYLHFQVQPSDSLPKKICASCFEELEGMHRFAINALKVQDNLLRLSKELPMTALDVCKSFSVNYSDNALAINDTIVSLTTEEVTEMEVQVDPMIFLEEDDQIDETGQENTHLPEHGANNSNKDEHSELSQNGELKDTEKSDCIVNSHDKDSSQLPLSANFEDQKKSSTPTKQNVIIPVTCSPNESAKLDIKHETSLPLLDEKKTVPVETQKNDVSGQNGSVEDLKGRKEQNTPCKDAPSQIAAFKKEKKSIIAKRNTKKAQSKTAPTENIKYTTYTCPICKKVVMKKALFKAHLETHKTDHKFACEICMRVFKKEINLTLHKKSHSELTTYPCAHCNRVYPTKSTLRSHLVSHSDERPHVCTICSKSFKRNQDLKFHLNQHNGLRPYRCPYCTKAFASSGNCFSHRRRAHMQEIERDRALKKSDESTN